MISCGQAISGNKRFAIDERNLRIRLFSCGEDIEAVVAEMVEVARAHGLEKLWGFVTPEEWEKLQTLGFVREGVLDHYCGERPGIGVAFYLSSERATSRHTAQEDAIVVQAMMNAVTTELSLPAEYTMRAATRDDCAGISRVLTAVYSSYPVPVDTADAVGQLMDRGVCFSVAVCDGEIVSVALGVMDKDHQVGEAIDCATLPEHRGHGLMRALVATMEEDFRTAGMASQFALARATSLSINTVLARLGYRFRGRFINNRHVAGDWEDMNLWVKKLG